MNASDPGDRSTRVEREIREILERADSAQTPVENIQAAVRRQRASARAQVSRSKQTGWQLPGLSPDIARIGGALVLAIAAAMIADLSRLMAIVLAITSMVAFFSLWVPARLPGFNDSPRWRGQRLDDDEPRFGFGARRPPPDRGPKRPPG